MDVFEIDFRGFNSRHERWLTPAKFLKRDIISRSESLKCLIGIPELRILFDQFSDP